MPRSCKAALAALRAHYTDGGNHPLPHQDELQGHHQRPAQTTQQPTPPPLQQPPVAAAEEDVLQEEEEEEEEVVATREARTTTPADRDRAAQARRDTLQVLRATPRVPAVGGTLPKSWIACLDEWEASRLGEFISVSQRGWEHRLRTRFNKRRSIYQEIGRHSQFRDCSLQEAAIDLDEIRVSCGYTLSKHLA